MGIEDLKRAAFEMGPAPPILGVLLFAVGVFMFGDSALPGGTLFSLGICWLTATLGGKCAGNVGLPPLVGMLFAGFILKNLGWLDSSDAWSKAAGWLKGVALAIIMLRAGLGLDLGKLKANAVLMGVLSWIPAFAEATTIALCSLGFFGFTITWGYLLGFVIADVSPAVTVPLLLDFQLQGYGKAKGIPTILLAGSGFNSVFAICAFGVTKSFIFSVDEPPWQTILLAFVEIFAGIATGMLLGWAIVKLFDHVPSVLHQLVIVLLSAVLLIFVGGHEVVNMSGGGALGVVVLGIYLAEFLKQQIKPVAALLNSLWTLIGQPYLFALLGASVLLSSLTPNIVSSGIAIVLIGLVIRAGITYVCTLSTDWNFKERLFTAITWCPKATVQAALSTVALDYVTDNKGEFDDDGGDSDYKTEKERAVVVLTVAVLSIILTAPIFAVAIKYTGERWLVKMEDEDNDEFPDNVVINLGTDARQRGASLGPQPIALPMTRTRGMSAPGAAGDYELPEIRSRRSLTDPAPPKSTRLSHISEML